MGYSSWFVLVSWCRPGAVYLLYVNLGQFISIGGSFNTVCLLGALVPGGSCTWGQLSLGAAVPGGSCRPGAVVATGQLSPGAAVAGGSCRWGQLSGGELSGGHLSQGQLSAHRKQCLTTPIASYS